MITYYLSTLIISLLTLILPNSGGFSTTLLGYLTTIINYTLSLNDYFPTLTMLAIIAIYVPFELSCIAVEWSVGILKWIRGRR